MVAFLLFLLNLLGLPFKSKSQLAAENAALRQEVIVLQRKVRGRVQLTDSDRLFFIQLYRWFPSVLSAQLLHSGRHWQGRIGPTRSPFNLRLPMLHRSES